jgi:rare lipoprotein A
MASALHLALLGFERCRFATPAYRSKDLMDAAPSPLSLSENPSASARLSEAAVALLLVLGLLYGVSREADFGATIVPIESPDGALVVPLAGFDFRAAAPALVQTPDRDPIAPADSAPAPADKIANSPRAEPSEPWPGLLRLAKIKQVFASGGTLATVVGIASTYNPFRRAGDADIARVAPTASGELYQPSDWTAAIQIDLRHLFGGVRYGRLYRPAFALVERGDKRAIVRINDVGPLRPGRVIDLNEQSMRYFDPTLRAGLLHDARITLLPGSDWTPGPVGAEAPVSFASVK